jgi:CubicO group peptidase (beta-lactamase class C family)
LPYRFERRKFGLIAVVASLAAPLSAADFGPRPGAALSQEKLSRVDDFLTEQTATGKIPGAILLIQRHGKPVYFKWFGKRDVDANIEMTPDTIFPLHSVTKTVTSVAAMMLVDRGRIALDDPVSKYIPSFANMKVGVERKDETGRPVLDLVPLRRPITIEDLLLHTSGITYGFYGEGLVKVAYDGIISAISTMPVSPNGSQRCRSPSSRARCGITAIRPTCSAASSRSSRVSRSISSRRASCSTRLA